MIVAIASSATAQESNDPASATSASNEQPTLIAHANQRRAPGNWGLSIWGVSYHINRNLDYNEQNWGLGVRHYSRPDWSWLGTSDETRMFFEADGLRNSWRGLVVPVPLGLEYKVASLSNSCSLSMVAAFTVAYYNNPVKEVSNIRYGPVPGVTVGCGHVKSNAAIVLSPSHEILAAIAASWTIVF